MKSIFLWSGVGPPEPPLQFRQAEPAPKTLLMERNSQLGGTTTTGGVAYPGLFDA